MRSSSAYSAYNGRADRAGTEEVTMAVVFAGSGEEVDTSQLTELLATAAGAPYDYLPVERIADYLSRLSEGSIRALFSVQDEPLAAVLLHSRFASLYPVSR